MLNIRAILISVSVWTTLLISSLSVNIIDHNSHVIELATIAARENFNKDQAFRLWGSKHGGVYVPPNKRTPPNPALSHIPNRDVVTQEGTKLTLMNPAYMLRQMMNEYDELYGIKAKITGLVLLNPMNKPDEWEVNAIHEFEKGIKEITEQAKIDGEPYLRFMKPIYMKESCLKCHGHLGFEVGDLRGGVGVAIPLKSYFASAEKTKVIMWASHGIIWMLGILTIIIFYQNKKQREIEKNKTYKLKQKVLDAEKASKTKSDFLSRMSHELRTPLNAILGFSQILEMDDSNLNDTQRENVVEILNAGHHLLALINDMLDLTRVESGELEISLENVNIQDILQQCFLLMEPLAKKHNIKLINNISKKYVVHADFIRLKQVLLNLISNAVKYNSENGAVTVDCKLLDDDLIHISIIDSGEGLSKDNIDKLFIPFERLEQTKHIDGIGIGLVITQYLIGLMNGTMGVESTVGKGSTFWIELKLIQQ